MWGATTPASAGDTFEFTPVPEVAAFGVACVGLLGLVYIVRYARLRRKMKVPEPGAKNLEKRLREKPPFLFDCRLRCGLAWHPCWRIQDENA